MENLFIPVKPEKSYPWYLRLVFHMQRKRFGEVLIPTLLWSRVPSLSVAFLIFYLVFQRKKSLLSAELQSLVMVRVAQVHECVFWILVNALFLSERAQHQEKLQQVSTWKTSPVFSESEKMALEYAEAMTQTDSKVGDDIRIRLKSHFSDDSLVELTALIAFQNLSSRFNAALKIPSQGLCKI